MASCPETDLLLLTAYCSVSPWSARRESHVIEKQTDPDHMPTHSEAMLLGQSLGLAPELLASIINTSV